MAGADVLWMAAMVNSVAAETAEGDSRFAQLILRKDLTALE
jgi:hypothetical protein